MNFEIILWLAIGHVAGDFFFQRVDWALAKKEDTLELLAHVSVYIICILVCLLPDILKVPTAGFVWFVIINAGTHALLDGTNWLNKLLHQFGSRSWERAINIVEHPIGAKHERIAAVAYTAIVQTVVDQMIHFTILYYTAKYLLFGG